MKTRSKQLASTHKATAVAFIVAFMLALFAMWSISTHTAYAEDEPESLTNKIKPVEEFNTNGLETFKDEAYEIDKKAIEEGILITIKPSEDLDVSLLTVEVGDVKYQIAEAGTLSKGKTYEIVVDGTDLDAVSVALYQESKPEEPETQDIPEPTRGDTTTDDDTPPVLGATPTDSDADSGNADNNENNNANNNGNTKAGTDSEPDQNDTKAVLYTVKFDTGEGSTVDDQAVPENTTASRPEEDPTLDGYEFDDWYADEEYTKVYDFSEPVSTDITIYAKWIEIPAENNDDTAVVVAEKTTEVSKETTTETVTYGEYSMTIGKTDSKTGATLSGAEFELRDSSGNTVLSWTTSANSAQLITGLRTDTTYVLVETKAPNGYNREKDINIHYDANSNKVLIDQGGPSVALENNSSGAAILNVRDIPGTSTVQASATSTPKTGDNLNLPLIIGVLVVVIVAAGALAIRARKGGKDA